jgi:hypothetical protein|tara:strand:+ start:197 stop:403 length:207 start_codon:yes stop_codon:yes gene_type:complete
MMNTACYEKTVRQGIVGERRRSGWWRLSGEGSSTRRRPERIGIALQNRSGRPRQHLLMAKYRATNLLV